MTQPTGPELLAEIAEYPSLDAFLDRDPHSQPLSDAELALLVKRLRAERALFTIKEQQSKARRAGIEEVQNGEES